MGIDACIYLKCKAGVDELDLDTPLPDGCALMAADDIAPAGASHGIDTGDRYYGPGYERGDWPRICALLLTLFASKDVETIWYFGDRRPPQAAKAGRSAHDMQALHATGQAPVL